MNQSKDFGFGEEQEMLKDSVRRYLEDRAPLLSLREATKGTEDPYHGADRPGHYDVEAWSEMVQLGWSSLAVPEESGGVGMSLVTAVSVAEEIGRAAMPTPLSSTLASTYVLKHAGSPAASEWLAKITDGQSAAIAIQSKEDTIWSANTKVKASADTLTGTAWYVQDLQKVDFLIVAARDGEKIKLYAVSKESENVTMQYDRIVDLTRDQGRVTFAGTPATCISQDALQVLNDSRPAILVLLAADVAGGCEWLLQTTTEYAKVRTQFDRPIGFFQAVKHPIVDMMIAVDETRSLVYSAASKYDSCSEEVHLAAHLAMSSACDTGAYCADRVIQLHGGIGFTWEHDAHIYHKRQMHSQHIYGDGVWHRQRASEYL